MAYGATPQVRFHPQKFPVEKFKIHEVSVGEALQVMQKHVSLIKDKYLYKHFFFDP